MSRRCLTSTTRSSNSSSGSTGSTDDGGDTRSSRACAAGKVHGANGCNESIGKPQTTAPGLADLREANAKLAGPRGKTGMGPRPVNGQLNRLVKAARIDEATIDQLHRRAQQAERWLGTL